MARLETYRPEKRAYVDESSGREIIQFTTGVSQNRGTYAALCPFDAEDRYFLFASNRAGPWQIFRGEIASGEIMQLTDREGVQFETFNVAPPGREMFYQAGVQVWGVDIKTGEERLAVDASSLAEYRLGGYLTFSPDGSKTLIMYRPRSGGLSALAVAALDGSLLESVFVREEGMQHPRWVPNDERTASFSVSPDRQNLADETDERRARTWQLDLETGKAFPLLVAPSGWRYTHEFWAPDGSCLYAHRKHVPNWTPTSIVSVPKNGGEMSTHYTSEDLKLGHSAISPDGKYVAIDVQEPNDNPILFLEMVTGRAKTLCRADASMAKDSNGHTRPRKPLASSMHEWKSYYSEYGPFGPAALKRDHDGVGHGAHPHPSFSTTGEWISYQSDRTGTRHVYLVNVRDLTGPSPFP